MKNLARECFHRAPERLNCSQAVLYAYQKSTGDDAVSVQEFRAYGGGRAPEGICGALHAACAVVPTKTEVLKRKFAAATGSLFCKEIKRDRMVTCEECVSIAADILEGELGLRAPSLEAGNQLTNRRS